MQTPTETLPANTTLQQALSRLNSELQTHNSELEDQSLCPHTWLVTNQDGILGVMTLPRLQQALAESPESAENPLSTLLDPFTFPHVHTDQGLDLALERLGANHLDILPVVSRANIHKLEGIVTLHDVLQAYGVHQP